MRPRRSLLLLPVLVPVALVTGCGSSGSSPAASSPAASSPTPRAVAATSAVPQTLELVERPTATTFTPKGGSPTPGQPARPAGPGDVVAFDATLTRAGAAFGHDHVSFTYQQGPNALVQATLSLPGGTLTARGTAQLTDTITLPVDSGSGVYAGRTGSLTAKHVNQQEDDLAVTLR